MMRTSFVIPLLVLLFPLALSQAYQEPPPWSYHILRPSAYGWEPQRCDHKWTAGVYRRSNGDDFHHICGGSLINQELVLSAAHCFWNNGNDVPLDDYRITLGNTLRIYDLLEDNLKKEIRDVIFHERFRGKELHYAHDIAIVRLKEKVPVGKCVKPVAIDWRTSFNDEQLQNLRGTVVGWGYTEDNEQSITRVAVTLPFVDFDTCWKNIPRDFRAFITPDKFCAGLRNGTSVCPGDSGGGLVFPDPIDNNALYIRGIVSVGVAPLHDDKCRLAEYSAFTSISSYQNWIRKKLLQMGMDINSHFYEMEPTTFSTDTTMTSIIQTEPTPLTTTTALTSIVQTELSPFTADITLTPNIQTEPTPFTTEELMASVIETEPIPFATETYKQSRFYLPFTLH